MQAPTSPDLPGFTPPPAGNSLVLSVSSLNRAVREHLEGGFPLCWVAGEVSNLTYASSGHVYFTLKDAGAQVRCVMWRNKVMLLGWRLENGHKVEARALVTLYEPRGDFQLNVEAIRRAGQGDLFQRFLALKARLEAEGVFDTACKRPIPALPRRVGIVTSPQAAALRDVVTTLKRRAPHVMLTLYPTPVQGDGAAERIAATLQLAASSGDDVLILCRGGGSLEDLWSFNDEAVARAIRAACVPVIVGVGHETDFTIADFAADLRAPTPTAAAEFASPDRASLLNRLDELARHLRRLLERRLMDDAQRLDWLAGRLVPPAARLRRQGEALTQVEVRLKHALERRLALAGQRLAAATQALRAVRPAADATRLEALAMRLRHSAAQRTSAWRYRLSGLAAGLQQLDPHAVLARGYAIARDANGKVVRDAAQLSAGDALQLAFGRGGARATVLEALPGADNQKT